MQLIAVYYPNPETFLVILGQRCTITSFLESDSQLEIVNTCRTSLEHTPYFSNNFVNSSVSHCQRTSETALRCTHKAVRTGLDIIRVWGDL